MLGPPIHRRTTISGVAGRGVVGIDPTEPPGGATANLGGDTGACDHNGAALVVLTRAGPSPESVAKAAVARVVLVLLRGEAGAPLKTAVDEGVCVNWGTCIILCDAADCAKAGTLAQPPAELQHAPGELKEDARKGITDSVPGGGHCAMELGADREHDTKGWCCTLPDCLIIANCAAAAGGKRAEQPRGDEASDSELPFSTLAIDTPSAAVAVQVGVYAGV